MPMCSLDIKLYINTLRSVISGGRAENKYC